MNKKTRICAIYCRVSTQEQNLTNQIEELENYTFNQNIKVYKIYKEKISGSKSSRPKLNELMIDAHNKKFDVVVVWKLDRLGRSLSHLIRIVNNFNLWGVDLIVVSQNIDTTTAGGKLIFHIMGAMAEFERTLISERTKLGLKNAKNVGKRGKDKGPRKKGGYYLRYQKKGRVDFDYGF